jgi:acetoin utilization deacetylase AcuC-like enzyme
MGRLRRALWRLNPWAGRQSPRFVYHRRYALEIPDPLLDGLRALRILSFLEAERLLRSGAVVRARPISLARLRRIHTESYLTSLQEPGALRAFFGYDPPAGLQDDFLRSHRAMVDGTVRAARLAVSTGGLVVNLGGGFHHARADRGAGYCIFNDVALAVAELRDEGYSAPILVIDLDLHDGDGTRALLAADATVHTFSIHNRDLDTAPALASTSIALGGGVDDAVYLEALAEALPPVVEQVEPGLVFYLAGCDPAEDDKLGDWRVSTAGMLRRDLSVLAELRPEGSREPRRPVVMLLAGGYGRGAWRYSARTFARLLSRDDSIEPPLNPDLPLLQRGRLSKRLHDPVLVREPAAEDWGLAEEDLGALGVAPRRFLGHYSRHGVELALERFGLLDRLRARGFRQLKAQLDLTDPMGHTLRIVSGVDRPVVLVEVRLRRDRRTLPGWELLSVEWLQMQDPGTRPTEGAEPQPGQAGEPRVVRPWRFLQPDVGRATGRIRPPMPGQDHPGLGLLREMARMLVLACRQLECEGLVFVPSHYHLAAQADGLASFLDPVVEGRFQALQRVLSPLSLTEAVRAVAEGKVRDVRRGEPFRWQPSPLIVPASPALRERFESGDYRRRVEQARRHALFALAPTTDPE